MWHFCCRRVWGPQNRPGNHLRSARTLTVTLVLLNQLALRFDEFVFGPLDFQGEGGGLDMTLVIRFMEQKNERAPVEHQEVAEYYSRSSTIAPISSVTVGDTNDSRTVLTHN